MTHDPQGAPRRSRSEKQRATGPVGVITAYVPPELARAARVRVAQSGSTLSALVTRLLQDHLAVEAAE